MIYSGTSGWAYTSWRPRFYPEKLGSSKMLAHYATRLNTVEVNYTFRKIPTEKILQNWISHTPDGFLFAAKANQRITHIKRLKEPSLVPDFLASLDPLRKAKRLGPVLFQLPPNLKCDQALLAAFLKTLPRRAGYRFSFEFRHESWFVEPVFDRLSRCNVALCIAESEKLITPDIRTADFVYCRFREGGYSKKERAAIADRVKRHAAEGDVFCYFKHEDDPRGALFAEELLIETN